MFKDSMSSSSKKLQIQFEELQKRASKDSLSGLLNRETAETYINSRLKHMSPDDVCAMFIIDLDGFKLVNDTLGHKAGDQVIKQASEILSKIFKASDIVGRLGGDEFVGFMSGNITEENAADMGRSICQNLQIALGKDSEINLTASVGIYMASGNKNDFDTLYQFADMALYKVKKNGKNGFRLNAGEGSKNRTDVFVPVNAIPLTGLLEYMDSGVALLELGSIMRVIYVSPSFCHMIGVEPNDYSIPKPISEFIHPDDIAGLKQALLEGLEKGKVVEHAHRILINNGKWAWWHIKAVKIEYNNPNPVMLVTSMDISEFKENELRLKEKNERLQTAFEQTTQIIWEVDIENKTIDIYENGKFSCPEISGADFPEFIISNGYIHSDSVPRFKEFAGELLNGKIQDCGNFIVKYNNTDCYGWAALSYRMLFDCDGHAVKAVGVIENLPQNLLSDETKLSQKHIFHETIAADLIMGLRGNLTKNTIKELWLEGRNAGMGPEFKSCSDLLESEKSKLFFKDDEKNMAEFFSRDLLIESFNNGRLWLSNEYRRVDGAGNIKWVLYVINLTEDPATQDICIFAYIGEIERRKKLELGIPSGNIVRDKFTGLYDYSTMKEMTETVMIKEPSLSCAFVMLYVGGLSKLYSKDLNFINKSMFYITSALSVSLGLNCIMGRYSNDKIVIFFPYANSKTDLRNKIEMSFSFARLALSNSINMDSLRFVAGAVWGGEKNLSYNSIISKAEHVCELWHNAAVDTIAFSQDDDDNEWTKMQKSENDDKICVHIEEMRRPLSESEKDVAFNCVSAMLDSDSLEASINSVLSYIGLYYKADRVYVLMLSETGDVVTMTYEWTNSKKHSIKKAVSGTPVNRFPLLKRCMEESAPVFLTRKSEASDGIGIKGEIWHFTSLPLIENGAVKGFLCIENSKEHPADAALFSTLIPHIIKEQKRFHRKLSALGDENKSVLTQMPNLRSYMEVIHYFNSNLYSSLGAVCVDVPDLSSINSSLGFDYGTRLLLYVSKTAADIFGNTFLFRTWDAEFVALSPNTTRQVFIGKCARLRTNLQRRYPKEVRIGSTWSGGVFSGKDLVSQARLIMKCQRTNSLEDRNILPASASSFPSVAEAAKAGRLTVFFQPKVNMKTGKLFGAEALVRGFDENGNMIPTSMFIDELEKNGQIRELDMYVLDRTMYIMDKWRDMGFRKFKVSVNISRVTLFSPSALASVLAIQSRYPLLSSDVLEFEITESAGNVESCTLNGILDKFREFGIEFGLDDFGSQYANISTFTNVKFDTVKLDRSLIAEVASNEMNRDLVKDIVEICNSHGVTCVAEGVETKAQEETLIEIGCLYAQGYFYDRPMPAKKFEHKYLENFEGGLEYY